MSPFDLPAAEQPSRKVETINLRATVDRTILEVFGDDGLVSGTNTSSSAMTTFQPSSMRWSGSAEGSLRQVDQVDLALLSERSSLGAAIVSYSGR